MSRASLETLALKRLSDSVWDFVQIPYPMCPNLEKNSCVDIVDLSKCSHLGSQLKTNLMFLVQPQGDLLGISAMQLN